jgi:hypothetical protein
MSFENPSSKVELEAASLPSAAAVAPAQKGPQRKKGKGKASKTGSAGDSSLPLDRPPNPSIAETIAGVKYGGSITLGTCAVLRDFLRGKDVPNGPQAGRQLYPVEWFVGRTPVPIAGGPEVEQAMREVLPNVRAYDPRGSEVHMASTDEEWKGIDRLVAEWKAPVEIVARILTAVQRRVVSVDDVLVVAQRSPEALEKLKHSGATFKQHFQRLLDPIALRRSPEFNNVSQRYKRQLRSLIDDQQRLIREARAATRRVNDLLGERDQELSQLDPGYQPKRQTAAAALARFGIDLGEEVEQVGTLEEDMGGVNIQDLDF